MKCRDCINIIDKYDGSLYPDHIYFCGLDNHSIELTDSCFYFQDDGFNIHYETPVLLKKIEIKLNIEFNKIYQGHTLEILKTFPNEIVDLTITSPPYYGKKRTYDMEAVRWDDGSDSILGLEKNPDLFIDHLIMVFKEVVRITKPLGTIVINIDDTSKHKDWLGIPDELRRRMRKELHLICYNEVIWWKRSTVPRSRKDYFTPDHEKIYFFAKTKEYYFKQQLTPLKESSIKRAKIKTINYEGKSQFYAGWNRKNQNKYLDKVENGEVLGANMRTTWDINPEYNHLYHTAQFPTKLVERCIKACCPEHGVVFDPFMGSGTTAEVAILLGRSYLGTELNPEFIKISDDRIGKAIRVIEEKERIEKENKKQKRLI